MIKETGQPGEKDNDILNIMQKFGKHQMTQYFLISLPGMFVAMNIVNYVFVAGDINYRCRIPECESVSNTYSSSWWPADVDRCSKPILNFTNLEFNHCTNNSFTSSVSKCTDWIYGSNDTVVAWLDLACQPWKTNFIGTIHSLGLVLGMMIGGWSSDRFGRKPTLITAIVGSSVGVLKTFMKTYYGYIFIELIEATLSGGAHSASLILVIEISGNDKRILSGVLYAYALYTGEALLAGIAYLVPYWKSIIYISCLPAVMFVSYIKLVHESPRWQVLNDNLEGAKKTLKLMVKLNNINNISLQDIDNLDKQKMGSVCNVEGHSDKEGYKEIFKSKEIIKRLVVVTIARFTATFIYFGLIASSVWLSGSKYMNYLITSAMSFPGDLLCMYVMDNIGRKWPLIYGYLVCGISCVAFAYVPESMLWLKLLFFCIGKLLVTACYTGIWAYSMELFPTSVRGTLFGLCTITSCAGVLLAPLTPAMDTISPVFSPIFFGCSAVLASVALILTPETKDLPLVGNIEEAENRVAAEKKLGRSVKEDNEVGFGEDGVISIHL